MNRLQYETSPYLLQHANNPVDWYPWSDEALERAKTEDKPIIVSIGYSTCHWCHVMERESFEDPDIAAIMNEHFVCIKVDREERPDIDAVYMEACQAISGGGGWPLNAFLLPDAKPFYAGTYFPPADAHNRPGWPGLLLNVVRVWKEKRKDLEEQAEKLTQGIAENNTLFISDPAPQEQFDQTAINAMAGKLKQLYDLDRGGFGSAPKFPMSQSLELLLDHALLNDDTAALQLVEHAMQSMINGGIYDQLIGGFARYTVDANWRIPHFEKMLYDNALLLRLLGKLQMVVPTPIYATTIKETINWLKTEMLHPAGTFYAALDADSEGIEGKFYIWDYAELATILSSEQLELLSTHFGITESGNWEEERTNILYRSQAVPAEKLAQWENIQQLLLEKRAQRIRPGRDEKIILQWNALMVSGLTYCYRALDDDAIKELAQNAYAGLQKQLFKDSKWHRNYKDDKLGATAFLDDLTALHTAQLDLYDITFDTQLIHAAKSGAADIEAIFGGAPGGLYFLTPPAGNALPTPTLSLYDNSLPSGNGQYLQLLRRLSSYTGDLDFVNKAQEKISRLASNVFKYPSSFANLGNLLLLQSKTVRELVISGQGTNEVAKLVLQTYRPDLTVVAGHTKDAGLPILKGRFSENEQQFYLCENQSCHLPVSCLTELQL